ncbi:MAG: polysaccharide deacetylase family protein [Myxococcales bacterium]|nr:polysaccharide deacetylase family protein [Myxococcales bacterium]
MSERLRAAVNVDVDGLYLYDRIHGHAGGSGNSTGFDPATAVATAWTRGVVRFLDLFERCGVKGTFFVVAQDLANPDVVAVLNECVRAGHEIGNHSMTHPYDLSRLSAVEIASEVGDARKALQDATGQAVVGFRAPGYVLSPALLEGVAEAGHVYDSSRFPCPPYQGAKAAVIGLYRALGRPSGSIPESPAVWLGERRPYVERTPSGRALLELPIGVLPGVRMPFIGTSLIALGEIGWQLSRPLLARSRWVNFECHAIDLTDHEADQIPTRLRTQPDQRVPLSQKWPLFVRAVESLARTHEVQTLGQWAEQDAQ